MSEPTQPQPYSPPAIGAGSAWDRRQQLDPTFWMAEDIATHRELWASGERDFTTVSDGLSDEWLNGASALEIGCGTGRLLRAATCKVRSLTGVDVSAGVIAEARTQLEEQSGIRFAQCNGNDLSVLNENFDFIYSFAALPHLTPALFAVYLLEVKRLLNTHGVARLQVYLGKEVLFSCQDTFSLRSYERVRLESACKAAGFEFQNVLPVVLPYDGVDTEGERIPVIISLGQSAAEPSNLGTVLATLVSRNEPDGIGDGSRDEYRFLITHANMLIRECKLSEAEKFIAFAVESYQQVDEETKLALELLRLAATEDHE